MVGAKQRILMVAASPDGGMVELDAPSDSRDASGYSDRTPSTTGT